MHSSTDVECWELTSLSTIDISTTSPIACDRRLLTTNPTSSFILFPMALHAHALPFLLRAYCLLKEVSKPASMTRTIRYTSPRLIRDVLLEVYLEG